MEKFEEYLDRAKDMAEDAGDIAKNIAGEAMSKAKELTAEGSKVRELKKSAQEQAATLAFNAKEKVEGFLQDTRAGKEIRQGINALGELPEFEGSILYTMELQSMTNDLRSLFLIINDNRLDAQSVAEEITKVMNKVKPAAAEPAAPQADADQAPAPTEQASTDQAAPMTDEEKAIEAAKAIAYDACVKALSVLH